MQVETLGCRQLLMFLFLPTKLKIMNNKVMVYYTGKRCLFTKEVAGDKREPVPPANRTPTVIELILMQV